MISKTAKKNVLVIFGGKSVEHDISIISGIQLANNLDITKFNVFPVYISKSGVWYYSKKFFDINFFSSNNFSFEKESDIVCVCPFDKGLYFLCGKKLKKLTNIDFSFMATHGSCGEDGSLQGLFETYQIPYSSPQTFASSVCMNKYLSKLVFEKLGIKQTDYVLVNRTNYLKFVKDIKSFNLNFPLIVKPNSLGSSIGITVCKTKEKLKNAISLALLFDFDVLVESLVENLKEVNIAIVGNSEKIEVSDIEEVVKSDEILSFENKYFNTAKSNEQGIEKTKRIIPANISTEQKKIVQESATKVYKFLNMNGVVRFDFLIDEKTGEVYLNEVNSIPGSLANYLFKFKGYSYKDLLNKIYEYSIRQFEIKNSLVKNFSSSVLKNVSFSGKNKLAK